MALPFDPIEEAGRQWRTHFSTEHATPMMAVTSIMRVQQLWLARCNEALGHFGLTFPRYEVLALLRFSRRGELPLGKIGTRLQVHPTSVTSLIDGLERDGLVLRARDDRDRRLTLARLTAAGNERLEAATAALHDIRFGTTLDDASLAQLTALLTAERAGAGDFD
ncbi:MarR family winged helix-turn-helix transcriptional regulator [Conexibacter sp. DBS9H8]|uniref:MarR family winged helix-turn-helix transcriptional regulator n=1 Tax=Conexibacter sp. DBS9H8 TaxID=2937801 RepID=UPI0020101BD7|nr:MarR family transcriptional regulator [Conexibacter sp. DBS9H8]